MLLDAIWNRLLDRLLREERGDGIISWVVLAVCFAGQAIAYVHARNIAEAASQDGARAAASGGPQAGITRATQILTAAGGAGSHLHASAATTAGEVTVTVQGSPPKLFSL